MDSYLAGFDIGGTKCAVILGKNRGDQAPEIVEKRRFATQESASPAECIARMGTTLLEILASHKIATSLVGGVGISCGGPLDSVRGIVQSPPNLPGWDDIPVVELVTRQLGIPARLENDANACALAEWRYGAGRGTRDMIFLTFGTGLGAGIIAGGALLSGTNGMAGECGHVRLSPDGPSGYGKKGSFEGFCSGGGIARLGQANARRALAEGHPFAWGASEAAIGAVTAKSIADMAELGDADAREVYRISGERLGEGLAILIDILNPECIVIGSVFSRSEALLRPAMEESLAREVLPQSGAACRIVPAALGEALGDMASLTVAASIGNGRAS